jgi:radical SAM protein with 4Fe4S-binding SPASM domain
MKPQINYQRLNLGQMAPLDSPLVVYMETTTRCNLACKFCPHYISPDDFIKGTMDFNLFSKAINDLKDFSPKVKLLRFCGLGDSLFNKDIDKYVEHAVNNSVADRYEMISNGLLLTESLSDVLSKNLDRLIISIEGLSDEDYLNFTNRKINFEKFIDQLKYFFEIENRKCKLHIKIHNSAVQSTEKIQKFYDIFKTISDEIYIENLINLWPNLISNLGLDSGHRFDGNTIKKRKVCAQIFKSIQINHDGKILPCCIDWKVINVIGDINSDNLHSIWNGKAMNNLRFKHLMGHKDKIEPCSNCTMNEESDIDNIDSYSEDISKRLELKYRTTILLN